MKQMAVSRMSATKQMAGFPLGIFPPSLAMQGLAEPRGTKIGGGYGAAGLEDESMRHRISPWAMPMASGIGREEIQKHARNLSRGKPAYQSRPMGEQVFNGRIRTRDA